MSDLRAERDYKAKQETERAVRQLEVDITASINPNIYNPEVLSAISGLPFDQLLAAVPYARQRRDELEAELQSAIGTMQTLCDRVRDRQLVFLALRHAAIKAMELGDEFDFSGAESVLHKAARVKMRAMDLSNSKEIAP